MVGQASLPVKALQELMTTYLKAFTHSRLTPHASRLVTLTGAGGSGKSRLALEVGRRLLPAFQGACWFVPLAEIADPRLVPDAILGALRLARSPSGDPIRLVAQALGGQPSLLILDNFEQLLRTPSSDSGDESAVGIVRRLLELAPSVQCLVTSRRLLGLAGEREFGVAPLPVPERLNARTPERLAATRTPSAAPGRHAPGR